MSVQTPTTLSLPPNGKIELHLAEDGKAESLTLEGNNTLQAKRLAEWAPEQTDLAEYEGRYFSDELETFYSVELGDDGLLVKHRRLDDIDLTPKVRDSFSATFPITEVAFDRNEAGDLKGMRVSNIRTRDIWFEKQE